MAEMDSQILTMWGEDMQEIRRKLHDMYGTSYTIIDKRHNVPHKTGFLGLWIKDGMEVKYVAKPGLESRTGRASDIASPEIVRAVEELAGKLNAESATQDQLSKLNEKLENMGEQLSQKLSTISASGELQSETITRIEENLDENEFTKEFIQNISERIRSEFSIDELKDYSLVEKKVVDWIGESIQLGKRKPFRPPHIIVIVGPTGVGKTTTVAKLAAQSLVSARKNGTSTPVIRMITIDRTRVGAEEQLVKYGNALGVQVDKAERPEDVKSIIESCKETVDYIFIDTSGYSPNDSESIGKMKTLLDIEKYGPEIFLAVSATTKARDLRNIIQNYELFGYTSVIITKCDETNQYGNVISVLHEKHKAISYITDGQSAARNIDKANIVNFLIRLRNFNIDRNHIDEKFGEN